MDIEGTKTTAARACFAIAAMGLGVLSIVFVSFSMQWEPVPAWVPRPFAYVSGIVLLLGGAGLVVRRTAVWGGLILAAFLTFWFVALRLPQVVGILPKISTARSLIGLIFGPFEDLGIACGAVTFYSLSVSARRKPGTGDLSNNVTVNAVRILFGIACLEYGASHFAFADVTKSMVPAWLPARMFFAYLTGAAHIAAGLALVSGIAPRLAATLEATMMLGFVLLVHIPMALWHKPDQDQFDWTLLCIAMLLASSAFGIAGSLRDSPWGLTRRAANHTQ